MSWKNNTVLKVLFVRTVKTLQTYELAVEELRSVILTHLEDRPVYDSNRDWIVDFWLIDALSDEEKEELRLYETFKGTRGQTPEQKLRAKKCNNITANNVTVCLS
jgi:hypothetical protein